MNQHQLWASIVNVNEPDIVVKAHSNFIAAGADILVTNSYKTNVPNLKEIMNYTDEEAIKVRADFVCFCSIFGQALKLPLSFSQTLCL